jgi:predicted nucleotidyltransferase
MPKAETRKIVYAGLRGSEAHNLYIPPEHKVGVDDHDIFQVYIRDRHYYLNLDGYNRSDDGFDYMRMESGVLVDCVGYELRKAVSLLLGCNPNVLGWLWLDAKFRTTVSCISSELIKNRQAFLSRTRVRDAFGGYAKGQFDKMMRSHPDLVKPKWYSRAFAYFNLNKETKAVNKYLGYMGEKRKALVDKFGYDTKNAAHLIRIYRLGRELLDTGNMTNYRTIDREELLAIKQGQFSLKSVLKMAEHEKKLFNTAASKSQLPDNNDRDYVNDLISDLLWSELKST